jgi:hypothetical protein
VGVLVALFWLALVVRPRRGGADAGLKAEPQSS